MQKKLLTLFICFAAIPILIIYLVFHRMFSLNTEKNLSDMYTANITNAAQISQNYFEKSIDLSMYPLIEPNLNKFYTADANSKDFMQVFDTANTILSSSPYIFGGIRNTTMLRMDGLSLSSGTSYTYYSTISLQEQEMADELNGKAYWEISAVKDNYVVYLTRLIKSKSNLSQKLGYIKTSTSLYELTNVLRNAELEEDSSYIILTRDFPSLLVTSSDSRYQNMLDEIGIDRLFSLSQGKPTTITSGSYFVSVSEVKQTPFIICSVIKPAVFTDGSAMANILLPVACMVFIFFLLLSILFAHRIARPMEELGKKMDSLSTGDFSVRAHVKGNDEISRLTDRFNAMSEQLDYLYNQVYQRELALNRSQLIALQSQINPHFLYNTIDTIYWMAQMGQTNLISKIASNMSQLFRMTITPDSRNLIPLKQELEHLNYYMEIQKIRYNDSISFSMQCEIETEQLSVLKLLLQPLVENALIHGLKDREKEELQIRIYRDSDNLFYEIRNNGTPLPVSLIDELLQSEEEHSRGFALRNIDKRLQLQYGKDFRLKYGVDGEFSFFLVRQPVQITRDTEERRL